MTRYLLPLSLLLAAPPAMASQTLAGSGITVYYDDYGLWNDRDSGAGFQSYLGGAWVEFTYPGRPYQTVTVDYTVGGVDSTYIGDSDADYADYTTTSEIDASTSSQEISEYTWTAGDLEIVQTETWDAAGYTILVRYDVTNTSATDTVDDLRVMFAYDADQDETSYGTYSTYNDVVDVDADGRDDWVESVGPYSGYAIGVGVCEPDDAIIGTSASWTQDAYSTDILDDDGGTGDATTNWVHVVPVSLLPGETTSFGAVISVAATESDALGQYVDDVAASCAAWCDADGDGALDPSCSLGDDCDDADASVNPSAAEVWYDGIDQNCDDGDDYDQDGDGYDSADYGGTDCDDTEAAAHPGAAEVWYDGIDEDCDGGSDYDQDGDGDDAAEYGGGDCDDLDASVSSHVLEVWYDGFDQNCDGLSDYDADMDGHDSAAYGGDDCDDAAADVYPGASQVPYDGVDQDCDGADLTDADGDGHDGTEAGGDDCDDTDSSAYPGATETPYDGIDQDCDGGDLVDVDGDGYASDAVPGGDDCDDADPLVHPAAQETNGDGVDSDCDGSDDVGGDDTDTNGGDDTDTGGDVAKGGGCGCDSAPTSASMGWLVGLVGLMGLRRRR